MLTREGKKKAVIYRGTAGGRVSVTRKINRTRKVTSVLKGKLSFTSCLDGIDPTWRPGLGGETICSLCVGGPPGASCLNLTSEMRAVGCIRSFRAVVLYPRLGFLLVSHTDATLVLYVQETFVFGRRVKIDTLFKRIQIICGRSARKGKR